MKKNPPLLLIRESLSSWFLANQRPLPWRENRTPYRVWISEIMLQQTRAETVIPYFERWMELFPTLEELSLAEEEKVIKAWEGLGYYSRARAILRAAKKMVEMGGAIPANYDDLCLLPGIGPYTAGAIMSFAYQMRAHAIDGNVARVLSRLFSIDDFLETKRAKEKIETSLEALLPTKNSHLLMEALIELGALVCKKKPTCNACPVQRSCQARLEGEEVRLPRKKKGPSLKEKKRTLLILEQEGKILLRQGIQGEIMEGLYEFPYFEEQLDPREALLQLGFEEEALLPMPRESHLFTRYRVELFPHYMAISKKLQNEAPVGYRWVEREKLRELPFSSGHRRVLHQFQRLYLDL